MKLLNEQMGNRKKDIFIQTQTFYSLQAQIDEKLQ